MQQTYSWRTGTELLHDMTQNRTYVQLKDLALEREKHRIKIQERIS